MDLRNVFCLISTSGNHLERDGSRQKPEPLDNLIRCLSSANQNAHPRHWIFFSAYTKWVVFCIVHCMMQSAMMAYINVQCILDWLPVSVSTEPIYSNDQFANSYSNPYKLNINGYSQLTVCFCWIWEKIFCMRRLKIFPIHGECSLYAAMSGNSIWQKVQRDNDGCARTAIQCTNS